MSALYVRADFESASDARQAAWKMCLPPPGDTPAYKIAYWDEIKDLGISAIYLKDHARGELRNYWAKIADSTPYTAEDDTARHKAFLHFRELLEENFEVQTRTEELEELAERQKARAQRTKGAAFTGTGQIDEQPSVLPAMNNRLTKPGSDIWDHITVSAEDPFEMADQQFADREQDEEEEYLCMSEPHTALLDKRLDRESKDPTSLDGKKRKFSDESTQIDTRRRAFMYLTVAGGSKRRKLKPLESKVGQKRKFVDEIIKLDARRRSSVYLAVAGGNKRRKLNASEPKANESRPTMKTKAEDQPPREPQSRSIKAKKSAPRSEWKKGSNKQDPVIEGYHHVKSSTFWSRGSQQPVTSREGTQPQAGNIHITSDKPIKQQEATPPPTPTSVSAKSIYPDGKSDQPAHEHAKKKVFVEATTPQASLYLPSPPRSPSHAPFPGPHADCSKTLCPPSGKDEEQELALEAWMKEVEGRIQERKKESILEKEALLALGWTSPAVQKKKRKDDIRPVRMSRGFYMFVDERISRWEAQSTPSTYRCAAQQALLESKLSAEPLPSRFAHEISAKVRLDVSSCRKPLPFLYILIVGARVHGHRLSSTLGEWDGQDLSRRCRVSTTTG